MIKFVCKNDRQYVQIRMEEDVDDGVTWYEVTRKFQDFLASLGYVFIADFDMAQILLDHHEDLIEEERASREV